MSNIDIFCLALALFSLSYDMHSLIVRNDKSVFFSMFLTVVFIVFIMSDYL